MVLNSITLHYITLGVIIKLFNLNQNYYEETSTSFLFAYCWSEC